MKKDESPNNEVNAQLLKSMAERAPTSHEFFTLLVKSVPFKEINNMLEELITPENVNQVKIQFFSFQIKHAYEIIQWQFQDRVAQLANEIYKQKQETIPKNFREYCTDFEESVPSLFKLDESKTPDYQSFKKLIDEAKETRKLNPVDEQQMDEWYQEQMKPQIEASEKETAVQTATKELEKETADTQESLARDFISNLSTLIETTRWPVGANLPWNTLRRIEIVVNGIPQQVPFQLAEMHNQCKVALSDEGCCKEKVNKIVTMGQSATPASSFFGKKQAGKPQEVIQDNAPSKSPEYKK